MKKYLIFFITILLLGVSYHNVQADTASKKKKPKRVSKKITKEDSVARHIFYAYPLGIIGNSFMFGYEFAINHKSSIRVNAALGFADESIYYYSQDTLGQNQGERRGLRGFSSNYFEFQYRFKVFEDVGENAFMYMAPMFLYKSMKGYDQYTYYDPQQNMDITKKVDYTQSAFVVGYVLGYQFVQYKSLCLDFYIGGGMMFASGDYQKINPGLLLDNYRNGTTGHIGLAIGFGR